MTAQDPEGRVQHQLDVWHSTLLPDGSPLPAGLIPITDGTGLTDYVDSSTFGGTAADVAITDAGGYFTATDVEAALQELAKKDIGYLAHGNTGATETFDALTGWHSATLDANCTFTFTGATSGLVASMVLELAQDGTGSRTVTWPGSVIWPGGTAPTLSTTAGATDLLMFFSRDGGTNWFGFMAGGGTGSALTVKDEGSSLDTAVTSIDFVGAGVNATNTGHAVTVTIAGGTTASDTSIWRPLMDGLGDVVTDSGTGEAIMAYGPT